MIDPPPTPERIRIDDPDTGRRPVSIGRTLVAAVLAASPGLFAAAVVWPLIDERWKPLTAAILAGTSLFFLALSAGAGWLVRRVPPAGPRPSSGGDPLLDRDLDR